MRSDIFSDTYCPLCGKQNLERLEHIYGEHQTALLIYCRDCRREFIIITHQSEGDSSYGSF